MANNSVGDVNTNTGSNMTTNNMSNNVLDETRQLITFHSDLNPVVHSYDARIELDQGLKDNATDFGEHTIKSFLERPKRLTSFLWHTTDAANTVICRFQVPFDLLNQQVYYQKVAGFMGFRATTLIRVQVNNTRFQQGRLLCTFYPDVASTPQKYNACQQLLYRSQWPRVEYDPSVDTEVSLEIPYVTTYTHYNLLSGEGSAGIFDITVFSPLVDIAGATASTVTVWSEFKDIELVYATVPTNLFPQAISVPRNNKNRKKKVSKRISREPQRQLDPSDLEADEAGVRPVSSFLNSIAATADIAKNIPLLSSIAGPVSWVAALAAKAAHAFGFSNPLNNSPVTSVIYKPTFSAINSSGIDNSYNMGIIEDNKVETLPGFAGTDLDELSIPYLLSIPTYFGAINWTTSNAAGVLLNTFNMNPAGFFIPDTSTTVAGNAAQAVHHQTPVTWLSNYFQYYRGSMRLTFKAVKTEFHTGRLLIAIALGDNSGTSFTNTGYMHRDIIDLRLSTEFTITVPWGSVTPYKRTAINYAFVNVYVLNELQAPPTVSSTITLLLEVSCDDDFEFAVPRQGSFLPCFAPFNTSAPASINNASFMAESDELVREQPTRYHFQVGDTTDSINEQSAREPQVSKPIGSAKILSDFTTSAKYCIGESIVSLRQLLKRTVPFYINNFTATAAGGTAVFKLAPYTVFSANEVAVASPNAFICDYFSLFAPLYAFMRGSVRLKVMSAQGASANMLYNGSVTIHQGDGSAFSPAAATNGATSLVANTNLLPIVPYNCQIYPNWEIQVPFYCPTFTASTLPVAQGIAIGPGNDYPNTFVDFSLSYTNTLGLSTLPVSVGRQIGEDFSFGFFTGTVPLTFMSVGTTLSTTLVNIL